MCRIINKIGLYKFYKNLSPFIYFSYVILCSPSAPYTTKPTKKLTHWRQGDHCDDNPQGSHMRRMEHNRGATVG